MKKISLMTMKIESELYKHETSKRWRSSGSGPGRGGPKFMKHRAALIIDSIKSYYRATERRWSMTHHNHGFSILAGKKVVVLTVLCHFIFRKSCSLRVLPVGWEPRDLAPNLYSLRGKTVPAEPPKPAQNRPKRVFGDPSYIKMKKASTVKISTQ